MSKKVIFSIILIAVGVISALLITFTYGLSGGNLAIWLSFLAAAILLILVGSILAFSRLLDRTVNPVVEEIHKDIEDDLQDIKERRITNTHWMVIILGLALLGFSFFVFRFHKVEASWGPVPVIIPTFIGMLALAWFIPHTSWFRYSRDHTPMWIFFIPTLGLIISAWLGLARTENMATLRATRSESISYNAYQVTGIFLEGAGDVGDLGIAMDLPDCDSDACGVMILVIVLIALTLVLVIGSAFIPHFWILSGSLLLGIMALIAIHDLRLRPASRSDSAVAT
ncbi:MAG TPA: hypothetical protein VLD65_01650 [Anaerolineales bacterium]|nr:hypothetical protein [Anaerolineales bacterium]